MSYIRAFTIVFIIAVVFVCSLWIYVKNHEVNADSVVEALSNIDVKVLDGNNLEGKRPWDVVVRDKSYFNDMVNKGTIGIGESYMDGKWDCDALDVLFDKIRFGKLEDKIKFDHIGDKIKVVSAYLFNQQSRGKSYEVEDKHYNIGNELYENMLGASMAYSCGYWKLGTKSLDEAQVNKFELICKKLKLKAGDRVLDIGSGFGGLAKYMCENYGCVVTGVNISKEQLKYAGDLCKKYILSGKIKFIDCDYRDIPEEEKYDKIVSVGFCEHVGYKNYKAFCQKAYDCLKPGGLFLLHTIGGNTSQTTTDPWIDKYIFPNGLLPSISQLGGAFEGLFVMEDWHNFGPDYDKTLMAWEKNYRDAVAMEKLKYEKRFFRMWRYYLLSCAGCFRSRSIQLWQIVLSKEKRDLYHGVR
ncbi:MAG: cyclopropane-fatty-acyl-phospholipid synthase [Harvfovirus sp.]|uniref:Cyclopropane-fatty-acyl-phospholipid synthase n=1 Tax=Harvfovirus sp. TaxID=2487768 RepID=A0A3G5A177_9VIRU|nr:MAG: cyclopropane-fatty-acyl-phospholipid synthase [Harvfovirus sp.]